jgi:hypothetical protein
VSSDRDESEQEGRLWPPAFFASAPGDGTSVAEWGDELLREGFGQQRVIICDTD